MSEKNETQPAAPATDDSTLNEEALETVSGGLSLLPGGGLTIPAPKPGPGLGSDPVICIVPDADILTLP